MNVEFDEPKTSPKPEPSVKTNDEMLNNTTSPTADNKSTLSGDNVALALKKKTPSGRNKWIAILIALFFGFIGAHKFYLGKTMVGVIYLLFCWTGIPAILAIIDIILLLTKTEAEFERLYG